MRADNERGPIDPESETGRALIAIENEHRARFGLPPITTLRVEKGDGYTVTSITCGTPTPPEVTNLEAGLLLDLRQKWADQPGTEH